MNRPECRARGFATTRAAALALLLLGGCASVTEELEQTPPEDARIASAVKRALIETDSIDAAAVEVVAADRVVTLGGFVGSEEEKRAVERAARESSEGFEVVSEIEVRE